MGIITTIEEQEGETVDSKTAIKMIEEDGWYLDRVKGSHHQYKHPTKKGTVTIPHPRKDLGHLEKSIKKQAGL
ncbi:type II toxin-antitoxin system HicA family toxin [Haemophilus haemolyticus]|uniref:type II toxin-antitoxin system HicA family toxin n=1 Tax=Haemophilus haemolyticus TaxID=726 RepID=UPI0019584321